MTKSRKEIIKECAAKLFRKKGYSATSMQDIAAAVGIKAASLYNHIQSKQELLGDILMPMAKYFTKGMDDIFTSSLNPMEKLERLIALHVRLAIEHTNEISLITGEWVHLEEPTLSDYTALRQDYEEKFRHIIKDSIDEGYIENVNVEIALFSILSTLHWLYSWYDRHRDISPIELEKHLIQSLLTGLSKKKAL